MKYVPVNLFEDFFYRPLRMIEGNMKTDIVLKDGFLNLDVELPGYDKEDIKVEVYNGNLKISATHNSIKEETDNEGKVIRKERSFGSCARSFYVGDFLKAEDIKAKFDNGILNIVFPSAESKEIEETKQIAID